MFRFQITSGEIDWSPRKWEMVSHDIVMMLAREGAPGCKIELLDDAPAPVPVFLHLGCECGWEAYQETFSPCPTCGRRDTVRKVEPGRVPMPKVSEPEKVEASTPVNMAAVHAADLLEPQYPGEPSTWAARYPWMPSPHLTCFRCEWTRALNFSMRNADAGMLARVLRDGDMQPPEGEPAEHYREMAAKMIAERDQYQMQKCKDHTPAGTKPTGRGPGRPRGSGKKQRSTALVT